MANRLHAALLASFLALPAWAQSPTPQDLVQTVTIDAPTSAVWEMLRDPASLDDWHPDVTSATVQGAGAGATRVTGLASGNIGDGIDIIDDARMTIRWRLTDENRDVIPASFYTQTVIVHNAGDAAEVTWRASFFRADTTNTPAPGHDDAAARSFMETYIGNGLDGLKRQLESGG